MTMRIGQGFDVHALVPGRALVPSSEVDKALAAGPVKTSFPMLSSPELDQVQRLMKLANSAVVQVSSPDFKLSLRRFS
jgi:oxaloacetate decarboxylase alpha subunit